MLPLSSEISRASALLSDSPTEKQHTQEPFEEAQKEDYLKCVAGIRYTTGPLFLTILGNTKMEATVGENTKECNFSFYCSLQASFPKE